MWIQPGMWYAVHSETKHMKCKKCELILYSDALCIIYPCLIFLQISACFGCLCSSQHFDQLLCCLLLECEFAGCFCSFVLCDMEFWNFWLSHGQCCYIGCGRPLAETCPFGLLLCIRRFHTKHRYVSYVPYETPNTQ